VLNYNKIK